MLHKLRSIHHATVGSRWNSFTEYASKTGRLKIRDLGLLAIQLLLITQVSGREPSSASLPTDRGRIRVVMIPDALNASDRLKVLRTDADTPLRAGTAWIWSQEPQEQPDSYYADLKKAGLNSVRLVLFDVWLHEEGHKKVDWTDAKYRIAMLQRINRAVNACSKNGLYAIINAHNRVPGTVQKYDEKLNTDLWTAIAPAFANRTHVIYELSNEALAGPGKDGVLEPAAMETLKAMARVHKIARAMAPNTHLMVLTPAGISGWGTTTAMSNLTKKYEKLTGLIDWSKTSVAYHLYHADVNLFPNAENIRAFHKDYPGWPSENNFPKGYSEKQLGLQEGDRERSVQYGSDEFIMQTCERLGLGWSQWQINGPTQFQHNWPILWNAAVAKGYAWKTTETPAKKP